MRDELEEYLWGDFETWVGGQEAFEHALFIVGEERFAIVGVRKREEDVD